MSNVVRISRCEHDHCPLPATCCDSISTRQLSERSSGKAAMISGQASLGNRLRCFQTRTAPDLRPTLSAKAEGPPFSSMTDAGVRIDIPESLLTVTVPSKPKITHGNVTASNVVWMTPQRDDSWKALDKEPWSRLRWARERWQKKSAGAESSAAAAAAKVGMKDGTYRAYERPAGSSKHTPIDYPTAVRFARAFSVNWKWLLSGEGSPFDDTVPAPIERVVRLMEGLSGDQQKALADAIEVLATDRSNKPRAKATR